MGLIKVPSFQSIQSDIESKVNNSLNEIQSNPNYDMDSMTSKIEKDIGIDKYTKGIEQAEGYASKASTVLNFIKNPKGAAVDYLKKKALEKIEEHPKTKEVKEKLTEYVKSKVESLPQYQEAKRKLDQEKEAIPDTPQELQQLADNPTILQDKIPGLMKSFGINIDGWIPKE